jgi:hypothetical protein
MFANLHTYRVESKRSEGEETKEREQLADVTHLEASVLDVLQREHLLASFGFASEFKHLAVQCIPPDLRAASETFARQPKPARDKLILQQLEACQVVELSLRKRRAETFREAVRLACQQSEDLIRTFVQTNASTRPAPAQWEMPDLEEHETPESEARNEALEATRSLLHQRFVLFRANSLLASARFDADIERLRATQQKLLPQLRDASLRQAVQSWYAARRDSLDDRHCEIAEAP